MIDITELPTKEYTLDDIPTCFYVEFDESGQPLSRVSLDSIFNLIIEKAMISGLGIEKTDSKIILYKPDIDELKMNKLRRSGLSAAKAVSVFTRILKELPDDIKSDLLKNN